MTFDKPSVADIFRHAGETFAAQYRAALPRAARRALTAIQICRTAELGAHHMHCDKCNTSHLLYNSCRNRNCPTCQSNAAQSWLERQLSKVIRAPYFHLVFTLPPVIASIAYANRKAVLSILMKTSTDTVTTIGADPKRFAAKVGGTAVLHTWNQRLEWFPHTHIIVPNGGFDISTGQFKIGSKTFFAPVKVLSRYFRNRFVEQLRKQYRQGELVFTPSIAHLQSSEAFEAMLDQVSKLDWNVYAKKPFAGPRQLLRYLSRYTHRVAIGSSRIVAFNGREVTFRYRKPTTNAHQTPCYGVMKLSAVEFIRRYLTHVLPTGFHRIRHFGIFANANVKQTLRKIEQHTGSISATEHDPNCDKQAFEPRCPRCQTLLRHIAFLSAEYLFEQLADARAPPWSSAA